MAESKKKASKASAEKSAAKPVAKTVAKPVSKPAAKAPAKTEAKPAAKVPAKSVAKPASKVADSKAKASSKNADAHSFNPEYLVLMQKDPNWMQAFWDVNDRRVQSAVKGGSKLVLRLYDISSDLTVRNHRNRAFRDFDVPANARSWYVQNGSQSGQFSASLGSVDGAGDFHPLIDSSHVISFGSEGQYLGGGDDLFVRASLGGVSYRVGSNEFMSSGMGPMLFANSSFAPLSSGALSSQPSSWSGSNSAWQGLGKDFFLWVKTRLIVYGGTRPDAHLQVRGEPFPLNPDGTFSFEQDLPDSTQIIPVFATDKDGDFPTTIIPIVVKRTE